MFGQEAAVSAIALETIVKWLTWYGQAGLFFYVLLTLYYCVRFWTLRNIYNPRRGHVMATLELVVNVLICVVAWPLLLAIFIYQEIQDARTEAAVLRNDTRPRSQRRREERARARHGVHGRGR